MASSAASSARVTFASLYAQLPERARCLLTESVPGGGRCDSFTRKEDDALHAFGRESGEGS